MGGYLPRLLCLILVVILITAGCTDPQESKTLEPVTPVATPEITQSPVMTISPEMTPDVSSLLAMTCDQQKGFIITPGHSCSGKYVSASDSFSCCSKKPVSGILKNPVITLDPFDFSISMNDTLGTITGN